MHHSRWTAAPILGGGGVQRKIRRIPITPSIGRCHHTGTTDLYRYPPSLPCLSFSPPPLVTLWGKLPYKTFLCIIAWFQVWSWFLCLPLILVDRGCLSRAADCLPFYSISAELERDQSYPLVPPYLKILHPPIEIVIGSLVTFPPLCGLDPIYGVIIVGLGPLWPLPCPVNLRGVPVYLSLGRRKGGPVRPRISMVSLRILPHILVSWLIHTTALDLKLHSLYLSFLIIPSSSSIYHTIDLALSLALSFSLTAAPSVYLKSLPPPNTNLSLPSRFISINYHSIGISLDPYLNPIYIFWPHWCRRRSWPRFGPLPPPVLWPPCAWGSSHTIS